jgi:hypothetical protein
MANFIMEFNSNLDNLLEYTINICPTDTTEYMDIKRDIVTYKSLINGALKLNQLIAVEKYILYMLEHEEQINARDEVYFININLNSSVNMTDRSLMEILKLKNIWHKLDIDIRTKIFDFMIVLTYWARQYFNSRYLKYT